jgi:hypothetical protein
MEYEQWTGNETAGERPETDALDAQRICSADQPNSLKIIS